MTLVKDGKAFFQGNYYNGVFGGRERDWAELQIQHGQWSFIAKEQDGGPGWKITKRKHQG